MLISTQVIDIVYGRPAADVQVRLERRTNGQWVEIATGATGDDGNVAEWSMGQPFALLKGLYRLALDTGRYFVALGTIPRYPEVLVVFTVSDPEERHPHTILLGSHAYMVFLSRLADDGSRQASPPT